MWILTELLHHISVEEQVRQAFVTKHSLMAIFFDNKRDHAMARQYGILQILGDWQFKGYLPILCT